MSDDDIPADELTAFDTDDVHGIIAGAYTAARFILGVMLFGLGIGVGIAIASTGGTP